MNNPRMFRRTELDALLRFIEANAKSRGDRSTYLMPSDVVWRLPGAGSKENLALWREIILEGLRRLKAKGVRRARVSTAGFNAPAQRLYEACGFERIDTMRTYLKRIL